MQDPVTKGPSSHDPLQAAPARISDVVRLTGLSKELIHHYLRMGLIPRSRLRGQYDARQVRLLGLVRTLREDHNLPLELVRNLFEAFAFDAERLDSLTQTESLVSRISRFADGSVIAPETLDRSDVARRGGVSSERIDEYVRTGILAAAETPDGERFSPYDANVVALCERAVELGIPFESLRTAASYVHVAFELEKTGFFGGMGRGQDAHAMLRELFLRQEVVLSFVLNMLQSVTQLHFRAELAPSYRYEQTLADILYQPSPVFVRRHEIGRNIDEARASCTANGGPEPWLHAAELLLHAGRYHEAVFLLEDCTRRWGGDRAQAAYGRAVVLAGDAERGGRLLDRSLASVQDDPRVAAFLALSLFQQAQHGSRPEALMEQGAAIFQAAEQALERARGAGDAAALECRVLCGWLLTALPHSFGGGSRGRKLLARTLRQLRSPNVDLGPGELPGQRERLQINAAYLLLRSNGHAPAEEALTDPSGPEELRTIICRLDPASAFAHAVYLDDKAPTPAPEMES